MKLQFSKSLTTDGGSVPAVTRADSRSTLANTYTSATTALSILLVSSQWAAGTVAAKLLNTPAVEIRIANRPSAQTIMKNEGVAPQVLMSALLQFHDRIVASQEDLPPEAAKVLYSNLWELYG